ncbi:hypothetical protein [Cronobacter muytjensii]|uniref:hypothetical protein n=1 Tax=Cronobacter muytjensii TaxID=413501 RepID=UPI001375CA6C|nr:hypothetical protein [Cronobacter muytjensii]
MKPQGARHEIILKNALRRFMLPLTQASQAGSSRIAPEWGYGALSSRIRVGGYFTRCVSLYNSLKSGLPGTIALFTDLSPGGF